MKIWKLQCFFLFAMWIGLLSACAGGGGSDTTTASSDDGGIGGTGISSGPIEDFGSLWVNGVKFETDASTVIIEGGRPVDVPNVEALRRYFRRGMVVQVHGTVHADGKTGVASKVFYGDTVQGAIVSIDVAARRLTVLDREVFVDGSTIIGDAPYPQHPLELFAVGNIVEVSGTTTADGAIRATWIGLLGADASGRAFDVETDGTITRHDATAETFFLGDIQVQYGNVSEDRRPDLADGQRVEVRGRSLNPRTVEATSIFLDEDDLPLDAGETFWLDGLVTQAISSTIFKVNDRAIVLDDDASFVNGTSADLRLNARVEVEGEVGETGTLLALRVIFLDRPPLSISLGQSVSLENKEGDSVAIKIKGGKPTYHATGLPHGLTLNATTGLISGVLSCESAGSYSVSVSAAGAITTSVWTVNEACTSSPPVRMNRPPILTSSGDHSSAEGEDILLEINAVEPDGDALTFEATGLPPGFVLDAATGLLTGTPTCTAAGLYPITVRVTDGTFTDSISFNWTVEEGC
jgi:hypothetical protein